MQRLLSGSLHLGACAAVNPLRGCLHLPVCPSSSSIKHAVHTLVTGTALAGGSSDGLTAQWLEQQLRAAGVEGGAALAMAVSGESGKLLSQKCLALKY